MTPRLIDANQFIKNTKLCQRLSDQEDSRYYDDIIDRIEAQPTAPAIPIDWMINQIDNSEGNKPNLCAEIERVLTAWETWRSIHEDEV